MDISLTLDNLRSSGNLRVLPEERADITDLTSNDYLGLGSDIALRESFFESHSAPDLAMSASASRLLGASQRPYETLERHISEAYGGDKQALLFNSGYHANTGIIASMADSHTLIVADKLVHASIIDGIRLSGVPFTRFRHNDLDHLGRILQKERANYPNFLIIVESVYSMDGDSADIEAFVALKKQYSGAILYVDEAHALGVCGPAGLGLCARAGAIADVDIIVGTFGKALASAGAFAAVSPQMKQYLVNKARSLIFSTALPPAQIMWTDHVWRHALGADSLREKLTEACRAMAEALPGEPSHIRPLIVGDARRAVELSSRLLAEGFKVLPIRTPTVPPGTERLRFSLSASIPLSEIRRLAHKLAEIG